MRHSEVRSTDQSPQPLISAAVTHESRMPSADDQKAVSPSDDPRNLPELERREPPVLGLEHPQPRSATLVALAPALPTEHSDPPTTPPGEGAQEAAPGYAESGRTSAPVDSGSNNSGRRAAPRVRKRDGEAPSTRPASLAKNIGTVQVPYVRLRDNVPTRKVGVVLPIDLIRRVKVFSAESGVSTTEFFEHAIEAELARRGIAHRA